MHHELLMKKPSPTLLSLATKFMLWSGLKSWKPASCRAESRIDSPSFSVKPKTADDEKSLLFPNSITSLSILLMSECTSPRIFSGNSVWLANWRRCTSTLAHFPFLQHLTMCGKVKAPLHKKSNKTANRMRNVGPKSTGVFNLQRLSLSNKGTDTFSHKTACQSIIKILLSP